MSQPLSHHPEIAECHEELLADPSLVSTFPVDGWMSINELPCLIAIHFRVVSEGPFTKLVMPEVWGQAGVDFTICSGKKVRSKDHANGYPCHRWGGWRETQDGDCLCHTNQQARMEPLVMLLTLIQRDSYEPAVVVVKIFTNCPYFPWGVFWALSLLDIATPPEGASTIQSPLSWLHLHQLLLYSLTQVILPKETGEMTWQPHQSARRHCGKAPLRSTIYYPWCHSHCCPCHISQHIQGEGFADWQKT